jgi:small subunit ribosomal protein S8
MDKIGYTFTRLRNAQLAGHDRVYVKYSKLNLRLIGFLSKEGFIGGYRVNFTDNSKEKICGFIEALLKKKGFIKIGRVSKPSRRVYVSCNELKSIYKRRYAGSNLTVLIVSTSQGLLSHSESFVKNTGGEILGYVL